MSKWQIFVAGAQTQNTWILLLVIYAGLNSVLSLAYYAPLVNVMYRKQPSEAVLQGQALPTAMLVPVLILVAAVVVVGFWPSLLQWLTDPAGAALLSAFGG